MHCRRTPKAIAWTIDDFLRILINFRVTVDGFHAIAYELTDVSRIRIFEGMQLVELFLTMGESTGTSENLREKLHYVIIAYLTKYIGLNEDKELKLWQEIFRGGGSDRAVGDIDGRKCRGISLI